MRITSALTAFGLLGAVAACAVSPGDSSERNRPAVETEVPATPAAAPAETSRISSAGIGVVESASVVSLSSSSSAAAGASGTAASTATMAYRVQMPDGSTRSVVQAGERFAVGERVMLTGDGRLTRP
jgi:hypothetical protein